MTNVHDILEKAWASGHRIAPNEAAVLFAAAVRLASAQGATLRARLLQIDDAGVLHLASFDDQAPEIEPGYLAPELAQADAPRKSEPRVQVYAAGALGYELLTGQRASGRPPGPELAGPLGDIVRMALAADRRERFGDLVQLHDAVEGVHPRPPSEGERNILMGLRGRWSRPPPEKEALAKLIEKLHVLEGQVQTLAKGQARIEAAGRETAQHVDRMLEGQQRLQKRPGSPVVPAIFAGAIAALAVIGAAYALGMLSAPAALRPAPVVQPPVQQAAPEPPAPLPAPSPAAVPDASVAAESPVVDAGAIALPDASVAAAEVSDAGAVAAVDAGLALQVPDAGPPPPAPAPAAKKKPSMQVSQAAMLHAVALSQVRRGESALEKGRAEEALESFRAALENEPTIAVAFRGMGMAYALQGNDAQALQAYDKYLKLAPAAKDAGDIRKSITELKARSRIGAGEK